MSRRWARKVRDLACHPHILQFGVILKQFADAERELRNGERCGKKIGLHREVG
jgi:hypothetical protein